MPRRMWSTLVPLQPADTNSGSVESAEHYVARLAHAMRVTPGAITTAADLAAGYIRSGSPYPGSWNGPGGTSLRRIEALVDLTGVPSVRATTFWALGEIISQIGVRSSRRAIRWCPVCISNNDESVPMERLVWTIGMVSACQIHGVQLEEACQRCGANQVYGRPYPLRRCCSSCSHALFHAGTPVSGPRFNVWIDQVMDELVAYVSCQSTVAPIPLSNFVEFLDLLKCQHSSSENLPKWIHSLGGHITRPSIVMLLNLAAYQGVTPLEILLSPRTAAAPRLFEDEKRFRSIPVPFRFPGNAAQAACCLTELCNSGFGLLPSLDAVLKQFKASRTGFRAAYPELCKRYGVLVNEHRNLVPTYKYSRAFMMACHLIQDKNRNRLSVSNRSQLIRTVAELARVDSALSKAAVERAALVTKWVRAAPREAAKTPVEDDVVATWSTGFRQQDR